MSDHADVVRACLRAGVTLNNKWFDSHAALDALVAERDEAREVAGRTWAELANAQSNARAEVAEAEVARLREALTEMGVDMAAWDAAASTKEGHR